MTTNRTNPPRLPPIASKPQPSRGLGRDHFDLIMQNKPNFQKSQTHLTISIAKTYAKMNTWSRGKNKPNFNSRPVAASVRGSGGGIAYFPVLNFVLGVSNLFRMSIFVLRASTQPPPPNRPSHYFYAKQTQFPKTRNGPNPLLQKVLWRLSRLQSPKKQTQSNPISKPLRLRRRCIYIRLSALKVCRHLFFCGIRSNQQQLLLPFKGNNNYGLCSRPGRLSGFFVFLRLKHYNGDWRRGDSNPRPVMLRDRYLHV